MLVKDPNNAKTKRQRVINTITENIRNGKLAPGNRLATVREMSEHFEISSSVVHSALKELVNYGMIECRGSQGFIVCSETSTEENIQEPAPVKKYRDGENMIDRTYLCCGHHSDLMWKYPRSGYEQIREKQWNDIRMFLKKYPSFHCFVEQSEAIRPYLEKYPEALEEFRTAVREKRLSLTGGFTIPDLNLCSGELLVRNLQAGRKYYEETFGKTVRIACMNDAFGMCGQLPQILVKSGYTHLLPGRRPAFPANMDGNRPFLWHGLDETPITVIPPNAYVSQLGHIINLPVVRTESEQLYETLLEVRSRSFDGDMFVQYFTEVQDLSEDLFWQIDAVNRTPGRRKITFGSLLDYCASIHSSAMPEYSGEFNPVFTGCYTTRIQVKQKMRKGENLLFDAEMLSAFTGTVSASGEAWNGLMTASFHDSLCGCHHDNVYSEVAELLDRSAEHSMTLLKQCAEPLGKFTVFHPAQDAGETIVEIPHGHTALPEKCPLQKSGSSLFFSADLPSCGLKGFHVADREIPKLQECGAKFRTDFYEADFSTPFPVIRPINGETVFTPEGFGEVVFRRDLGSMWSEIPVTPWFGRDHMRETIVSCKAGEIFFEVMTEGSVLPCAAEDGGTCDYWDGFGSLNFRKEYRFFRRLDYFTLKLTLEWHGCNTKIAIRFPTSCDPFTSAATYDVPFGTIERKPYFEVPEKYASAMQHLNPQDYAHAAGEWPALHWIDLCDHTRGLAVANSGTPGFTTTAGVIAASLIRSGTKTADGAMTPQKGAWDNGVREYEFAFTAHRPGELHKALKLGRILNRKPRVLHGKSSKTVSCQSFLSFTSSNIVLSSLRAHSDGSWIVRCYESLGSACKSRLQSEHGEFTLSESDLTEREFRALAGNSLVFEPFEIKTLKINWKGREK